MEKLSVKDLIEGVLAQDDEVFMYLYKESFKEILWLIRSNNGNEDDAKDIFQDAMMVLHYKISIEKIEFTCSPKTFLYAVSKNLWMKELGRRSKQLYIPVEDLEYVLNDEVTENKEDQKLLKLYYRHFKELSNECKKILHLHLKNLSVQEITRRLGFKSDAYTMDRKYRCKQRLIQKIEANPQYRKINEGR
jgi:RNA polymerase sigma factor (sigma-70 family)